MMKTYKMYYKSPIGIIEIVGTSEAICSILFCEEENTEVLMVETPSVLVACYTQLDEYFKGYRRDFSFPYSFEGTVFQKSVWQALKEIPYAEKRSYRDIALSIGNEKATRAVGNANGKNKLSIVLPCHRVIGSDGQLTGYAGGQWRKEWLLQHEQTYFEEQSNHERKIY